MKLRQNVLFSTPSNRPVTSRIRRVMFNASQQSSFACGERAGWGVIENCVPAPDAMKSRSR